MSEEQSVSNDCPICLQPFLHPTKLPCGHVFCFLCVKGISDKNLRCALCRQGIPAVFLNKPTLVDVEQKNTHAKTEEQDSYVWYYEGRNGWWQYDERTTNELEDAYKRRDQKCSVLVAGNVYIIDFRMMHQFRTNDPSKHRKIKRDLVSRPKKGVGGLRIKPKIYPEDDITLPLLQSFSQIKIM